MSWCTRGGEGPDQGCRLPAGHFSHHRDETPDERLIERMREAATRVYPWSRPIVPEPLDPDVTRPQPRRHEYPFGGISPTDTPAGDPPSTGSEDETRSN